MKGEICAESEKTLCKMQTGNLSKFREAIH